MKNAGAAMKQIHGGLTIDKVDATMDELREQHALGEEIASAITNAPLGDPVDETELEEELEGMEQEAMDERMLKSGSVPVGGEVSSLPSINNGPSKWISIRSNGMYANSDLSTRQSPRRRRRGRRAAEAAGRDGDVVSEARAVQPVGIQPELLATAPKLEFYIKARISHRQIRFSSSAIVLASCVGPLR
jgi:hypothetical protein